MRKIKNEGNETIRIESEIFAESTGSGNLPDRGYLQNQQDRGMCRTGEFSQRSIVYMTTLTNITYAALTNITYIFIASLFISNNKIM